MSAVVILPAAPLLSALHEAVTAVASQAVYTLLPCEPHAAAVLAVRGKGECGEAATWPEAASWSLGRSSAGPPCCDRITGSEGTRLSSADLRASILDSTSPMKPKAFCRARWNLQSH